MTASTFINQDDIKAIKAARTTEDKQLKERAQDIKGHFARLSTQDWWTIWKLAHERLSERLQSISQKRGEEATEAMAALFMLEVSNLHNALVCELVRDDLASQASARKYATEQQNALIAAGVQRLVTYLRGVYDVAETSAKEHYDQQLDLERSLMCTAADEAETEARRERKRAEELWEQLKKTRQVQREATERVDKRHLRQKETIRALHEELRAERKQKELELSALREEIATLKQGPQLYSYDTRRERLALMAWLNKNAPDIEAHIIEDSVQVSRALTSEQLERFAALTDKEKLALMREYIQR